MLAYSMLLMLTVLRGEGYGGVSQLTGGHVGCGVCTSCMALE